VYNGKDSSEKKCQSTEIGLNLQNQRQIVRESIYNIENRLEKVTKRILEDPSKSNKKLPDELPNAEDVEKLVNAATTIVFFHFNRDSARASAYTSTHRRKVRYLAPLLQNTNSRITSHGLSSTS
jgi:hypothetical protein